MSPVSRGRGCSPQQGGDTADPGPGGVDQNQDAAARPCRSPCSVPRAQVPPGPHEGCRYRSLRGPWEECRLTPEVTVLGRKFQTGGEKCPWGETSVSRRASPLWEGGDNQEGIPGNAVFHTSHDGSMEVMVVLCIQFSMSRIFHHDFKAKTKQTNLTYCTGLFSDPESVLRRISASG